MASIIPRGGNWRATIRRKGASLAKTFDTEAEARAWADAEEARIKAGATAAQVKRMPSGLTVAELFERYARDVSVEKGGWRFEVNALRKLAGHFPMAAAELDGAAMAEWRDRRLKEVKASSVNRELALIGAVYTRAIKEWRLPVTVNPAHAIQRPKQPAHRTRRVSEEERETVIRFLGWDGRSRPRDKRQWIAWGFHAMLR